MERAFFISEQHFWLYHVGNQC